MTNAYRAVQWNRHKRLYDLTIAACVTGFVALFALFSRVFFPPPEDISAPITLIRALGICAILMLHLILLIGPLARLTPRAAPLLYNRRHLGVSFFVVALLHALLVVGFYGGFGNQNPLLAVLDAPSGSVPFEFFGFLALIIFALMAATSHDFWLANLGHAWWKTMHMLVYLAYLLVLAHVLFGALRSEGNILPLVLMSAGAFLLFVMHVFTGAREVIRDAQGQPNDDQPPTNAWVDVCAVDDIKPDRAKIVQIDNHERIAVFRHNDTYSAITNVCAHQGGPLGEGKVVDGCVTCPWHGYQYKPDCGQSPPPYTEKIATYDIRVEGQRILINPEPNPPGTPVEPARPDPTDNQTGNQPS